MKTKLLAMVLAMAADHALSEVGGLTGAEVTDRTSISNPASVMKHAAPEHAAVQNGEGQWIAFSLPVLDETRSPCCWKGRWNGIGEAGCSLERKHESYGTRSDSPLADQVIVYGEIRQGEVRSVRVVGNQCPVEGGGAQVLWIGAVEQSAGLDWLESVARSDEHDAAGDSALYALALHRSDEASQRLYALAREPGGELAEEAVFWLGESRGQAGLDALERLLAELPAGETRQEINFALARNGSEDAVELLYQISRTDADPEQRGGALFWLADEFPQRSQVLLLEVIGSEQDEEVLEQAIFAITQLPGDTGSQMLLDLARDDQYSREVRRHALFWLANSEDENTVAALTELLTR
jgi:hypothetical protein